MKSLQRDSPSWHISPSNSWEVTANDARISGESHFRHDGHTKRLWRKDFAANYVWRFSYIIIIIIIIIYLFIYFIIYFIFYFFLLHLHHMIYGISLHISALLRSYCQWLLDYILSSLSVWATRHVSCLWNSLKLWNITISLVYYSTEQHGFSISHCNKIRVSPAFDIAIDFTQNWQLLTSMKFISYERADDIIINVDQSERGLYRDRRPLPHRDYFIKLFDWFRRG